MANVDSMCFITRLKPEQGYSALILWLGRIKVMLLGFGESTFITCHDYLERPQ